MPLSVDLEATIDETCAEILRPWVALTDDQQLDLGRYDEALRTVKAHGGTLRALRIVDDGVTPIPPDALQMLLALPALADLEVLMLPMCSLGKAGAEALAAASRSSLFALRLLDVRQTRMGDAGALALASSPLATRLEHLSIAGALLEADGFRALLDSPLGKKERAVHVEEEDQPESLMPTLLARLHALGKGDVAMVERAFTRLLAHPALTKESSDELRYQWDLVMSN
jgi:hypothetical protein